jgi:hypothetical protein
MTQSLISVGEKLTIETLDGKEFIYGAKDVFNFHIDEDYKKWNLDRASVPTKEVSMQAHELAGNSTFVKIFTSLSLSSDFDKLCPTQHQIKRFCQKYPNKLSKSGATIFPFNLNEDYFLARVFVCYAGLYIDVHRFERVLCFVCGFSPTTLISLAA